MRRIFPTFVSMVAFEILPPSISGMTLFGASHPQPFPSAWVEALASHVRIACPPGISRSIPALMVADVEYVLPQSEITNPLNPHSFLKISPNK